jgi:hypothetical protein
MASLILPCSSRMLARRKRVNEGPRSGCAAMRRFIDSAAGTGVAEPAAAIPIYRRRVHRSGRRAAYGPRSLPEREC